MHNLAADRAGRPQGRLEAQPLGAQQHPMGAGAKNTDPLGAGAKNADPLGAGKKN